MLPAQVVALLADGVTVSGGVVLLIAVLFVIWLIVRRR